MKKLELKIPIGYSETHLDAMRVFRCVVCSF